MIRNNIDITITAEQAATIETGLETVHLGMGFLVSVSPDDTRSLFKLGPKSESFVLTAMGAAGAHATLLPPGIQANMQRDAAIREKLRPILAKLQLMASLVEGTFRLAGADLMKNSTAVYHILRLNGHGEGLDPLIAELATRFRQGPATEPITEPDPEPTPAP